MNRSVTLRPPVLAGLAVLAALLAVALTGCGGHTANGSETGSAASTTPSFASASTDDIKLADGWVSAPAQTGDMPGMDMSSGSMSGMDMSGSGTEASAYATLSDTGASGDALVSVSTPVASKATLHSTKTSADGSAGTMVDVADIAVPAGGHVTLAPGGYHVMLEGLKSDLKVGTKVTMTWTFRSGASVTTSFPVIDPADRPQDDQ